jgi:WD40 repeat protein
MGRLPPLANWPRSLAFSPDGRRLATGDYRGEVHVWRIHEDGPKLGLFRHASCGVGGIPSLLTFSPDGSRLAVGTTGDPNGAEPTAASVWLVDVAAQRLVGPRPLARDGWVTALAFRPDGDSLAAAVSGQVGRTFGAPELGAGFDWRLRGGGWVVAGFSPDGRGLLAGDADGVLRYWDARTGREKEGGRLRDGAAVEALAYAPDGPRAAVASGGVVRLWDLDAFAPLGPPMRAGRRVVTVGFPPGGRSLVAATADGATHRWPVQLPQVDGDAAAVTRQVERQTGLSLFGGRLTDRLPAEAWEKLGP